MMKGTKFELLDAIRQDDLERLQAVLDAGVDPNANLMPHSSPTPATVLAAKRRFYQAIPTLLSAGASPVFGDPLRWLTEYVAPNQAGDEAAYQAQAIDALVDRGVRLDHAKADQLGFKIARFRGGEGRNTAYLVPPLIRAGWDPTSPSESLEGNTPVEDVVFTGNAEILAKIIHAGFDVRHLASQGLDQGKGVPLILVAASQDTPGNARCLHLLHQHGCPLTNRFVHTPKHSDKPKPPCTVSVMDVIEQREKVDQTPMPILRAAVEPLMAEQAADVLAGAMPTSTAPHYRSGDPAL